ncbi:unnamed protein product [Didymodactylos carnosus]|uniref:RRM domain-containing protein n=1 Tax=Didymodactylos carnosus TaxID=1234261 RepID=A0A8S2D9F5_9BILA|nr:unnamed protein product [Didymodactylos carnosus]CAF3689296.1 unnamed protein product [Didymodactylos carnosus]
MMPPLPAHVERFVRTIFVQNIPAGTNEDIFRQILLKFSPLLSFHMFFDHSPSQTNDPNDRSTSRGYAFAEFSSIDAAQVSIRKLNGLDLAGYRLVVDLLAKQPEAIIQLFEKLCAPPPMTQKADPRLASSAVPIVSLPQPVVEQTSVAPPSTSTRQEEPESISNAVASLPPAQMFELMKQMKQCIQANLNEAKTLLSTNAQLAYALLQAQVVMRIVNPQVAMALLNRQEKEIPKTDIVEEKKSITPPPPPPLPLPPLQPIVNTNTQQILPTAPTFPFSLNPLIPPNMLTNLMPLSGGLPQQQAFLQAAMMNGMFPGGLLPPPPPPPPLPIQSQHTFNLNQQQQQQQQFNNPLQRSGNIDENAALLLLQFDDSQLAHLPPMQQMQIRQLRDEIAKTGLLPKM